MLTLANKWARDTYRSLAPENASPMQQATAREIVIAQMVEEVEAIPKWSPEEEARPAGQAGNPRPLFDARGSTCASRTASTGFSAAVNTR